MLIWLTIDLDNRCLILRSVRESQGNNFSFRKKEQYHYIETQVPLTFLISFCFIIG